MNPSKKAIGIFGGTFDPVHNGHLTIAKSFLNSGLIDNLWVLLSPYPPHKKEKEFVSYPLRLEMLHKAFEPFDQVIVSDIELHLPKPSYTVQTLAYFDKLYSDYSFYLCIGKDSFYSFMTWHQWETILDYSQLLVADRPVAEKQDLPQKLINNAHFVDHETIAISSTQIRAKIHNGDPVDHLLPTSVLQIIEKENLYRNP